jgi:uncharacterized membrane protein
VVLANPAAAQDERPPTPEDPVVTGAVQGLGGPPGHHARRGSRRFWTPIRWLVLLTLVTSLFGWWQKSPCRVHPWEDSYQYTRGCYTDVFALYFAERLNAGFTPYLEHPVEYPVVIGGVMAVAAEVVTVFPADQRPRRFYDVTWAILTACALVVVVTTARLAGRRRVWDAALFAVAPLLVLQGSTNWDLVAMALVGLGLLQWSRRRPLAAGVLLGLATATKLYPVLFLVPLLALCWRAGRLRAFGVTAAALVLTPILISLPVYLTSPYFAPDDSGTQVVVAASPLDRLGTEGLSALAPKVEVAGQTGVNAAYRFVDLNSTRPADWDSLWFALQNFRGTPLDPQLAAGEAPSRLNLAVAVSLLGALTGIVVLALRAQRRPRLMPLLFLTALAFLLTNKVWSPQFSLWLVPLALLARPRWRPFLAWQAAEALVLFTRFYFFIRNGDAGEGIDVKWFLTAIGLRDLALLVFAGFVVRDVLHPDRDVVRQEGVDDPAGGLLDGAPDRARRPEPAGTPDQLTGARS